MGNKKENIIIFIKPNFIKYQEKIIQIIRKEFELEKIHKIDNINEKLIYDLYSEYKDEWFYEKLINYYKNKTIILIFINGNNIMEKLTSIIGNKDPSKANKNTIRNIFSNDSLVIANKEKRIIDNVIHFQEDKGKMNYEFKLFKKIIK